MQTLVDGSKFKVILPAELQKGEDGEWRVYGLASTNKQDTQGETIDLKGLDLSPIQKGRGVFNFDHKKGPENTVGAIDCYKKTDGQLYLGGYLFKNHDRAKALHQIMSSLKKSDRGRVGLSVEGIIKQRDGDDGKTIKKAVITACAITMNPINEDTYADLVKSLAGQDVEFESDFNLMLTEDLQKSEGDEELAEILDEPVEKALTVGTAYADTTPGNLTDGDALAQEDLDKKKKRPKKMDKEMYKSSMLDMMDALQKLYPHASRSEIWETVKDRVNRKFIIVNPL